MNTFILDEFIVYLKNILYILNTKIKKIEKTDVITYHRTGDIFKYLKSKNKREYFFW